MNSESSPPSNPPNPSNPFNRPAQASTGRSLRWWHWLGVGLAVLGLAALLTAWWVYRLWHSTPAHWQQSQIRLAQDAQAVHDLAVTTQRRVLDAISENGIQAGEQWDISVSYDEINAWLAVNFDDLLAHQGLHDTPFQSPPIVTLIDDRLVVACPVMMPGGTKIVSLYLAVGVSPDGLAFVQLRQVQINRLSVPVQTLLDQLQRDADDKLQASAVAWLMGQAFDPVLPHPGNARLNLRLVDLSLSPQAVVVTVRAQPRR